MDDRLTPSDISLLLAAMAGKMSNRPFTQWISEEVRLNSLARDRGVCAKLITLQERAGRGPDDGPEPDDGPTAADIVLLFSALTDMRRVKEEADWISEEMRQDSLDRIRALERKLIALRDAAGRETGP